jgi:hypothetical protein
MVNSVFILILQTGWAAFEFGRQTSLKHGAGADFETRIGER